MSEKNYLERRMYVLGIVAHESEQEHQRKVAFRKADEIWWDPDPNSLWVWELETTRRFVSMGHTSNQTYSRFFITRDLAERAACNDIKGYLVTPSGYVLNQKVIDLIDAGKYVEAIEDINTHYGEFSFKFKMTEIKSSVKIDP